MSSPLAMPGSQRSRCSSVQYFKKYGRQMSLCRVSPRPAPPVPAAWTSSRTTRLLRKSLTPPPPYSSGTSKPRKPCPPAEVKTSRGTMPARSQSSVRDDLSRQPRSKAGPQLLVLVLEELTLHPPTSRTPASPGSVRLSIVTLQQLTGLDASLHMETGRSFGHVSSLSIYRRPADRTFRPFAAFRAQLERRLPLIEPFRRRLVEVPFGLDRPYWIADPDFDLDFHVREIALARPGNAQQLADQVSRIIARPLDRARPLWRSTSSRGSRAVTSAS